MNRDTNRVFKLLRVESPNQFLNQPSSKGYTIMTRHISHKIGAGWRLPRSDPHHLLKFPRGKLVLLFNYHICWYSSNIRQSRAVGTYLQFRTCLARRSHDTAACSHYKLEQNLSRRSFKDVSAWMESVQPIRSL
jgi:hypothetical protein